LSDRKYNVTYNPKLVEFISKVGFDEVYGARPIKRAIQDKIEDFISEMVLTGKIKEGKKINLTVEDEEVKIGK
jgi:ATP-dependent Clp protease ATP-binding subunit ClpC